MSQLDLLATPLEREIRERDKGMARAAAANDDSLALARRAAQAVALRGDGTADVERVREDLENRGFHLPWGNWTGALFRTPEWEFTGRWIKARHEGGHARPVRVWRWAG